MGDEKSKALLEHLRLHRDEIAVAAGAKVVGLGEPAAAGRAMPDHSSDGLSARSSAPAKPDRVAQLVVDGFKHLGPVVGLAILAAEPGLIRDDVAWLRRAFRARNVSAGAPGWEAGLLEAYADGCCEVLGEEECKAVRDILDRAKASLAPA